MIDALLNPWTWVVLVLVFAFAVGAWWYAYGRLHTVTLSGNHSDVIKPGDTLSFYGGTDYSVRAVEYDPDTNQTLVYGLED